MSGEMGTSKLMRVNKDSEFPFFKGIEGSEETAASRDLRVGEN